MVQLTWTWRRGYWAGGRVNDYYIYSCKIKNGKSKHGLDGSRITHLFIFDPETGEQILAYKKGWLLKPGSSFHEKIDFPEMLKIIQRFPKVG